MRNKQPEPTRIFDFDELNILIDLVQDRIEAETDEAKKKELALLGLKLCGMAMYEMKQEEGK